MSRSCYEMSGHCNFHHFKSPICEVVNVHQVEHGDQNFLLWWHRCSTSLRRYCRPRPHHGQWVGSKPQSRGMIGGGARICCWARNEHGCQMAISRFLDRMCLALRASGLWLRYAAKFAIWQPWERGMSSSSVPMAELFVDHSCNRLLSLPPSVLPPLAFVTSLCVQTRGRLDWDEWQSC